MEEGYRKTGVNWDYINAWMPQMMVCLSILGRGIPLTETEMLDILETNGPPKTYEEYFAYTYRNNPEVPKEVNARSRPLKVEEINRLAIEAQKAMPRILKEKDFQALIELCSRANMLVRGYRFP